MELLDIVALGTVAASWSRCASRATTSRKPTASASCTVPMDAPGVPNSFAVQVLKDRFFSVWVLVLAIPTLLLRVKVFR